MRYREEAMMDLQSLTVAFQKSLSFNAQCQLVALRVPQKRQRHFSSIEQMALTSSLLRDATDAIHRCPSKSSGRSVGNWKRDKFLETGPFYGLIAFHLDSISDK